MDFWDDGDLTEFIDEADCDDDFLEWFSNSNDYEDFEDEE